MRAASPVGYEGFLYDALHLLSRGTGVKDPRMRHPATARLQRSVTKATTEGFRKWVPEDQATGKPAPPNRWRFYHSERRAASKTS